MTKKRIQRTLLRAVTADEAAFRETLAFFGAFLHLGISHEQVVVGFYVSQEGFCSPMVVIEKEPGYTYRINNQKIRGTVEQCEARWRAWVIALVADDGDRADEVTERIFRESYVGKPECIERLLHVLADAKMLGEPDPTESDYSLLARAIKIGAKFEGVVVEPKAGEGIPLPFELTAYQRAYLRVAIRDV